LSGGDPADLRGWLGEAECSFREGNRESLQEACQAILLRAPADSAEHRAAEELREMAQGGAP
ncbi:MAG TPA: hypothetical protein VEN81_16305, partial [Planctomycetota bacterium]|nr:hypothetical protein [Planctomycetota bacterium]